MSAGLFGLLDDVAAIAKLAAASLDDVGAAAGRAMTKTVGVVIDDAAVTPQYVSGLSPKRELSIVWKIALGSIRNKLFLILPVALLLSEFLPDVIPVILIAGGLFLTYEGVHKVVHSLKGGHHDDAPLAQIDAAAEKKIVSGAIRTDLILSTEIMIIALNEVADESIWQRLLILLVVAFAITIGVYGVVAAIVKMDDVGLTLAQRRTRTARAIGRGLLSFMPILLKLLTVVGTAAMIWVGGHLLLVSSHDLGLAQPYGWVHDIQHDISHAVSAVGGLLGWLFNTFVSAVIGFIAGAIVLAVIHFIPKKQKH